MLVKEFKKELKKTIYYQGRSSILKGWPIRIEVAGKHYDIKYIVLDDYKSEVRIHGEEETKKPERPKNHYVNELTGKDTRR